MSEVEKKEAPRLRMASTIDLRKADAGCGFCHGTGVSRYESVSDSNEKTNEYGTLAKAASVLVPVICRCVSRNGGVRKDKFDILLEDLEDQVATGSFAENLACDVLMLPADSRSNAIRQLEIQAQDCNIEERVREQITQAISLIATKSEERDS